MAPGVPSFCFGRDGDQPSRPNVFVRVDSRPESIPRPANGPSLSPRVKPRCGSSAARRPGGVTAAEGRSEALSRKGQPSDVCEPDREPGPALNWPHKAPVLRYFPGAHRGPQPLPVRRYCSTASSVKAWSSQTPGLLTRCRVFKVLRAYKRRTPPPLTRLVGGGYPGCFLRSVLGRPTDRRGRQEARGPVGCDHARTGPDTVARARDRGPRDALVSV